MTSTGLSLRVRRRRRRPGDGWNLFCRLPPSVVEELHAGAWNDASTNADHLPIGVEGVSSEERSGWEVSAPATPVDFLPLEIDYESSTKGDSATTRTIFTSYNGGTIDDGTFDTVRPVFSLADE